MLPYNAAEPTIDAYSILHAVYHNIVGTRLLLVWT